MKKSFNRFTSAAAAAACAVLVLLPGTSVRAAGSQIVHGHVPAAVARLRPIGELNGTNHLKLVLGLPLRDQAGLSQLLQQIYDPASPNYHHYLTPAQFAERFGPTAADYQTLMAFAASHNLTVAGTHPNRTLLDVEGTVADIGKALHLTLRLYRHPAEPRVFYAPDTEPSIDLTLPLLHIGGLDNYMLPHPNFRRLSLKPAQTNRPAFGSGPGGTYLGNDFRAAYVPGVTLTGAGQSVGLLEFDTYYPSDILAYEQLAGLPNVPLVNVPIDGFNSPPGDADGEVSLDIEMAVSMAPGLSQILIYEAPTNIFSTDDMLNRMANDNLAKQLSASWTYPIDSSTDPIFLQMAAQGQSFFNAAGDSGAYPPGEVPTPSDDTNITIVGGTTLFTTGPGGAWQSEVVWSWFTAGTGYSAGSGGISSTYAIPPWQLGINMVTNQGSTNYRNLPDVALTADNIWVIYNDGQSDSFGGTSCATPLWAAFTSLVNQQAAEGGRAPMGFINPAIYALAQGPLYTNLFHDIVVGNNTNFVSPNLFYAVPGYDLCTGWGTPTGSNLINALAPPANVPVLAVVTNIISGGNGSGIIDFDECNNLEIVLTNEGGVPATGIEATLLSTTYGVIVAQGTSAYPTIPTNGSAANSPLFKLSTEPTFVCGTPVDLTLLLKYDQGRQTNYIQLPSGNVAQPVSMTNSTAMSIPSAFVPVSSPIAVSNLQSVAKVTVSLFLQAQNDGGMTLQLASPNGTTVLLSQNNGAGTANYGSACVSNQETTFDDAAVANPITGGMGPFVGVYQPQQALAAFNLLSGTNLNGTWNLQVQNSLPGSTATLECWTLTITPNFCEDGGGQCPGSQLSLAMSASASTVFVENSVVCTLTLSNAGPSAAQNVLITQVLPASGTNVVVTDVYVTNNSAAYGQAGSNLYMTVPSLPVYGSVTIPVSMTFTTNALGTNAAVFYTTVATVSNSTAAVTLLVTEPEADLAVTMTGSPVSVLQDGLLTYTINVTNNGPYTATNVTLSTTLPANVNFISATSSQGTVLFDGAFAELGNVPVGTKVVVTIVVSPTLAGNITASATVSLGAGSFELDPNLYNNSASVSTVVGPAADLSVTALVSPSPVVEGRPVGYIGMISNAGPSAASGLVFNQSLPPGSTFLNSSLPGHTATSNSISATISNLASGGSVSFVNFIRTPTLQSNMQSNLLVSTLSVFGQPGDPNLSNNVLTLTTVEEPPTVTIVPAGASVVSGSTNGAVGTNGAYTVALYLQNMGNVATTNLVATLLNGNGVTSSSGAQTYGALEPPPPPTPMAGQYSFTANSTNGGTIQAVLQLQDGTNSLGTATFDFVMPVVKSFWNTNFISIPDQKFIPYPDSGPANPYPSAIVVSNVSGDVSAVTVTVSNLIHSYPNDIGMLLVAPGGANCALMSSAAFESTLTAPITVTFDQYAPLLLPADGELASGSYQPADYYASQHGQTETFSNSLAPFGPYNTNLAILASIPANGTWSLYIEDDAEGDAGAISNGWGLSFTILTPVNQVADLAVGFVASTNQVVLGNDLTNVWTVTNNGPNAADIFLTNILPAGLALYSNTLPPGASDSQNGPTNIYNLGTLNAGTGVAITNVVTAQASGLQTNSITAGSLALNGSSGLSTASVVTLVVLPPADLAVGPISVVPNPGVLGDSLVYTLYVTNNGPSNALNVVGVFTNLSNLLLVSVTNSQGNYVVSSNSVQCNLGAIASGEFAVVVLTATPTNIGILTNGWSVTNTLGVDDNLSNNSTTIQVPVILPVAVITNGPATLLAQASPPYNGAINSNQTNTVAFTLVNTGTAATRNLVATLLANSGIRPITTSASYGAIAPGGGFASQAYTFVGSGSPGAIITAELSLQDQGNTNLGPVFYSFMIPATAAFSNPGAITIPDMGAGAPYPSSIEVSGLSYGGADLSVGKVTVTLNGFTHSWPHDVEVALTNPSGQKLMLMEHTGAFYAVSNLVLTFDSTDTAATDLPLATNLYSGTFLPTAYSPFDILPGLAAVPTANTNLSIFNGTDPNGVWSLYVYDDSQGNNGVITAGWSLGLTAVSLVNTAPATNAPPTWTNLAVSPGGIFEATLNGAMAQIYVVETSSNLATWTPVSTNTGVFVFTNSLGNASQRFYRAVQLSP